MSQHSSAYIFQLTFNGFITPLQIAYAFLSSLGKFHARDVGILSMAAHSS